MKLRNTFIGSISKIYLPGHLFLPTGMDRNEGQGEHISPPLGLGYSTTNDLAGG